MGEYNLSAGNVWITKAAAITALGNTSEELWEALLAGRSGIRPVEHFAVDKYISQVAASIPGLSHSVETSGKSRFGCLLDRLLPAIGSVSTDTLLMTATTKAGIENVEHLLRNQPANVQEMIPAKIPQSISATLGLNHKGININAACASSTIAVARAAAMISSGRSESVLVCGLDVVTDFVFSGFSCLRALDPEPCMPFDVRRRGLTLGEGAAALLLMNAERAEKEGLSNLGTVVGWGAGNDAAHITAPARDGSGLVKAISSALKTAGLDAADIAAINAHGTGTVYNDAMELTAFRRIFGDRTLPVCSVKGAIGHTLGAAGGIEIAVSLKSLSSKLLPPTTGLTVPESRAEALVSSESQSITGDYILTTNSGFGGINAAVILEKGSESQ